MRPTFDAGPPPSLAGYTDVGQTSASEIRRLLDRPFLNCRIPRLRRFSEGQGIEHALSSADSQRPLRS